MLKRIVKALTWRVIGTAEVFAISFLTTGHVESAGSIAGFTAITSTALFVFHEKLWNN